MSTSAALAIVRLMDLLATGLTLIPEVRARYDEARTKLTAILEEGREPTDEEFAELLAESEELTQAIRDAVAAKSATTDEDNDE